MPVMGTRPAPRTSPGIQVIQPIQTCFPFPQAGLFVGRKSFQIIIRREFSGRRAPAPAIQAMGVLRKRDTQPGENGPRPQFYQLNF